ncbi:helix-turn-helix domain-containing protein [Nocardia mangyaensis]|nr:helix-turn-helix domain-containing protein [Nocardia mangyaensis]MDO3651316.1 helix-turn-helix domain-containing protein [Nocardia mangyaensis]
MKGIIGTNIYLFSLFPKKISNKIKDIKISKEVKIRLKWIQHYQKTKNISKTCRYFGISRTTFYKWYKRYKEEGIEGLYDIPKTPKNKRKPIIRNKYQQIIIKIKKKYPTWSKEKIAKYLEVEEGIKISPSTVYRVLKQTNLIQENKNRRTEKKNSSRINKKRIRKGLKATFPGEVIQIDVKHITQKGGTLYQFTAIDKYSRLSYGKIYKSKSSRKAKEFFIEAREYFGFDIKKVQTDNGSEFLGEFDKYLKEEGIEHYFSYPNSPKTNANVERLIRSIEEELWLIEGTDYTIDEL